MAGDYALSAHYVSSLAKVLEQQRLWHVCPMAAAASLENPWAHWWWPGSVIESVFVAVRKQAGDDALRLMGSALLQQHMTPGLVPAISWLLSASGVRPSTLLSKLDLLTRTVVRGVEFEWQPDGHQAGVVRVCYPQPAQDPVAVVEVWRGVLEQVFALTQASGRITAIQSEDGVVEAKVAWD